MENLAVITALYHSGSFRNHLLGFRKKKVLFTSEGRSVLGKTVPSEYPRPWAQFFPVRTSRLVNNIYLLLGSGPTSQSLTSFSNPEIRTRQFTENENYNSYTIKTKRPSSVLFLPAKKI